MRRVLIVVVLIIGAAILGLWRSQGGVRQGLSRTVGASSEDSQGDVRDELRKSFELQPGARVEVQGINGSVEVQTSDTKTAEVYVLRTAKNSESLSRREVVIEQTASGLVVRGKDARRWAKVWRPPQGHTASDGSSRMPVECRHRKALCRRALGSDKGAR